MALLPRRTALVAVLTVGAAAAFQPVLIGQAFGAAAPAAPGSLAPNSSTVPQKDPVLSWSDVSGATSYQVELSRSNDWTDASENVKLSDSGKTTTASYALPQTLVHGTYFWRVRAVDGSTDGAWSANALLDRAWDMSPDTTASNPTGDATAPQSSLSTYPWRMAWTPIQDASSYEVEVSTSPSFVTTGQDGKSPDGSTTVECITDATSFTPYSNNQTSTPDANVDDCDYSNLDVNDGDYWRVRGIDDSTSGLVTAANQKNDLECAGIPDSSVAAGSESTGSALGTPSSAGQECSEWSAAKPLATPVYGDGSAPTPSTVSGFTVNGCGTGSSASNFACTTTPEFSWQPYPGAQNYTITVADDADFTNIEHQYTTEFLSLTPRDQLADYTAGNGYYVAIQACNQAPPGPDICGNAVVKSFTKQSPPLTGLAVTKVTGGFRLAWNDLLSRYAQTSGAPAVEAENYLVEVTKASDTNFENPALTVSVNASCDSSVEGCYGAGSAATTPGKDQTIVSLQSSGNYIWRVMPVDLTGNIMPASNTPGTFTADLTPPAFHLTPGGAAVNGPLTITATEATVGASAATLKIVPVGATAAVAGTLKTGTTGKTFTFTPSKPLVTGGSYKLVVAPSVTDAAGNVAVVTGAAIRLTKTAKDTSKGWTYSSGWTATSATSAFSGSFRTASAGKTAHVDVAGSVATLYACKSPTMGSITVTVDGHSTTVSEHLSYTKCGVAVWHHALTAGTSTVTVKVAKGKGNLDEVAVS